MTGLVLIWVCLAIALLVLIIGNGARGGTLVLAYFFGLSMIHVPGAIIFMGSAPGLTGEYATRTGFEATLIGMAAFLGGTMIARRNIYLPEFGGYNQSTNYRGLGTVMISLGFFAYFIALPIVFIIPSLTVFISSLASLLIIGFWCYFYDVAVHYDRKRMFIGIGLLLLLPLSTMISGGFLGFGVYWILSVGTLVYVFSQNKLRYLLASPFLAVLGLSVGVAYFGERNNIREAVWYEQADLNTRFNSVSGIVDRFELLDIENPEHIAPLNARLNQNYFVGLGIDRHKEGFLELEYGSTVPVWAFIPRAIWKNKPGVGGGGDLVIEFTGLQLSSETSWGAGQPLEFYMNFGWIGIVGGFLGLGFILMRLDLMLVQAFTRGDIKSILLSGMPGIALLQPGGNLIEILVAVVASIIAALILSRWVISDVLSSKYIRSFWH